MLDIPAKVDKRLPCVAIATRIFWKGNQRMDASFSRLLEGG